MSDDAKLDCDFIAARYNVSRYSSSRQDVTRQSATSEVASEIRDECPDCLSEVVRSVAPTSLPLRCRASESAQD